MLRTPPGPTLLGFDVIMVGTVLAFIMAGAVMLAIYAAVTVRDPMAKRVKALNERREQLKAGIVTSASKKRASLVRKTDTTDKMRDTLSSLKVLQDSQLKMVQQKLAQAGIRKKELAFVVLFARMILPIVLGTIVGLLIFVFGAFPEWSSFKKVMLFGAALGVGYKGPEIYIGNLISKRTHAVRKGLPDALDLLVICAEAGLTVDAAFNRVAKELGRAYPELGDEFALTSIELAFLTERRHAFENLAFRVNLEFGQGRGHHHDPDRALRYAAGFGAAGSIGRVPQRTHDAGGRKGRPSAGDHDRAADSVHPAGVVRRHSRPGVLLDQRHHAGRQKTRTSKLLARDSQLAYTHADPG